MFAIPLYSQQRKALDAIKHNIKNIYTPLNDEELRIKEDCERSLRHYVKHAWRYADPAQAFISDWHIDAICDHLQALYALDIRQLVINVPPRMGKSLVGSVLFPTWCWVKDPTYSSLCVSYGEALAFRLSNRARDVVESPWYQRFWGQKFKLTKLSSSEIENNKGGSRAARTIKGGNLGHGANLQILDDPNNIATISSSIERDYVRYFMETVLPSRYTTLEKKCFLLIQQRLHVQDATGYKLSRENKKVVHLTLPGEFDPKRKCSTIILPGKNEIWSDPRKEDGDLLGPYARSQALYQEVKEEIGTNPAQFSAQIQQLPLLSEDLRLNPEWFKTWDASNLPEFEYVIQSWDTALVNTAKSCYSACTTWGVFRKNYEHDVFHIMLLNLWAEKQEYPILRKSAQSLYQEFMPHKIVVESKVNGYSMQQDLVSIGLPAVGFNPSRYGNKQARLSVISAFIEAGFVWLPTQLEHPSILTRSSQRLLGAASCYPSSSPGSDTPDIIDSMSQALIVLTNMGYLSNREPFYEDIIYHGEIADYGRSKHV